MVQVTARKRLGGIMIEAEQTWQNKLSGERVVVDCVNDEIVTVRTKGGLLPMRKFKFLQEFERMFIKSHKPLTEQDVQNANDRVDRLIKIAETK